MRMAQLRLMALAFGLLMLAVVTAAAAQPKEMRGVWMSAATTAKGGETPEQAAERLATAGINAVFVAYEANSEPLRALLAACKRQGIETHLWIFRPPVEAKPEWKCLSWDRTKKTMVPGRECFCDEEYLKASEEKARSIVREYDVDGVQFDEVAFGMPWQSLCDRCRKAFAADTKMEVRDWPNDVIQVDKVTATNTLNLGDWRGPYLDAFVRWRCQRVAKYLRRIAEASRSVRPITVSYAAMAEPSANEVFYGEDLAELAKVFDYIVPMSYYTQYAGMSGGRPEWTAEVCQALTAVVHRGNPNCSVYAGISAYGADGGWYAPVKDLYARLVASGAITEDQRKEHVKLGTCKDGFVSLEWLKTENKITPEEYDKAKASLEARTPTSDEMVRAVQAVRKAGLPGFVFFRYECMFEDRGQGVIGTDLWPRLKETFAERQ